MTKLKIGGSMKSYGINILDNTFDVITNKKTNEFFWYYK